jgi:hypothetical protein
MRFWRGLKGGGLNWLSIVHSGRLRGCVARQMLRDVCSSAGVVTLRAR